MENSFKKSFTRFAGRFTLIYVLAYFAVAVVFIVIQDALPASSRVALDFFEPYRLGLTEPVTQVLRGFFIALVLYPFYDLTIKGKHGLPVLFAALWGVALLGSLEPKPGSIEGMIYTQTTFLEHFLVLAAGAVQVLLLSWLFLRWEKGALIKRPETQKGGLDDGKSIG